MSDAPKYTPGGRGHVLLARIDEAPRGRRDLQAGEPNARTRRKIPFILSAMLADHLIYRTLGEYRLTDEGFALLDHLDRRSGETRRAA